MKTPRIINKASATVFLYSLLIKLLVCFSQSSPTGGYNIAFPICLMFFTWICIEEYKSEYYTASKIALTIFVGTLILTLPIRMVHFHETIGSLPQEILGIAGICAGWLFSYKHRIWLLLLILMAFIGIAHVL